MSAWMREALESSGASAVSIRSLGAASRAKSAASFPLWATTTAPLVRAPLTVPKALAAATEALLGAAPSDGRWAVVGLDRHLITAQRDGVRLGAKPRQMLRRHAHEGPGGDEGDASDGLRRDVEVVGQRGDDVPRAEPIAAASVDHQLREALALGATLRALLRLRPLGRLVVGRGVERDVLAGRPGAQRPQRDLFDVPASLDGDLGEQRRGAVFVARGGLQQLHQAPSLTSGDGRV